MDVRTARRIETAIKKAFEAHRKRMGITDEILIAALYGAFCAGANAMLDLVEIKDTKE